MKNKILKWYYKIVWLFYTEIAKYYRRCHLFPLFDRYRFLTDKLTNNLKCVPNHLSPNELARYHKEKDYISNKIHKYDTILNDLYSKCGYYYNKIKEHSDDI